MKDDNVIAPAAMIGTTGVHRASRSHAAKGIAEFARIQSAPIQSGGGNEAFPGIAKKELNSYESSYF